MPKKNTARKVQPGYHNILVTNIECIVMNGVRLYCNALLLEEGPAFFGEGVSRKIRGFGPDPCWTVFDMFVSSLEYEDVAKMQSNIEMLHEGEDEPKPIASGVVWKFKEGFEMNIFLSDQTLPLDLQVFSGPKEDCGNIFEDLWRTLSKKVFRYWQHPGMPALHTIFTGK